MSNGLFQHGAGTRREVNLGEVLANRAVHRRRGREIGNQRFSIAHALGQRLIVFRLEEIDVQVAQTGLKTLDVFRLKLRFRYEAVQAFINVVQVLLFSPRLTSQGDDAGVGMQQSCAVKLVQGGEQLAHCQVAQRADKAKVQGSTVIEGIMLVLLSS